jgi:molecular chaperone GrpE
VTTDNNNPTAAQAAPSGQGKPSARPESHSAESVGTGSADVTTPNTDIAEAPDATAELRAERDRMREQLLRTAADFDNFRKRSKRDVDDARQRGKDEVIRDLLPVFDNLERAVQSTTGATEASSVIEGVRMVLKLFEDTTERLGLERVKTIGERFDPAVHEALQQTDSAEHAPGTIVAEIAPGYRFGERLVRPAMVVVSRKPAETKSSHVPDNSSIQSKPDERPPDA